MGPSVHEIFKYSQIYFEIQTVNAFVYSTYKAPPEKKAAPVKKSLSLKHFFTGIIYSIQRKKWPKTFPRELILRQIFILTFTVTLIMYFL